jgi:hypothetical protein
MRHFSHGEEDMDIEHLYKYGSLYEDLEKLKERSEPLFSEPKIWLSRRKELNDPFECRPGFNFEGTKEQWIEFYSRMIKKNNPLLPPYEVTAEAVAIYLEGRHKDPQALEAIRKELIKTLEREIGLYCLSEINNSILMWSHYADNHKGYCLKFEATGHSPVFGEAQKVINYKDDYPIIEFFNTSNDEQVNLTFLTKYIEWEYEQEWRIIDHENGSGWHTYPRELLKGVIFGVRMPEGDKGTIREWVGRRDHTVQLYQAVQHNQKYSIEVKEII